MKDRNKVIIAIVAVLLITVVVVGATYAYWTWVSNTAQQTNVGFTITQGDVTGDLYATLEGNGTTTATSLEPATCTSSDAIKKTITIKYKNATVQDATITATLKVTNFTIRSTTYAPTATNLGYLKYALTTSSSSCTTGVQKNGSFNGVSGFTTTSASTLPTLFSQTFTASANMTSEGTQTYYLYIWLDSTYAHTNTGNVNSDPMQGLSFTVQWSGDITQ